MFKFELISPRANTSRHSEGPSDTPLQRSHLRIKPEALSQTLTKNATQSEQLTEQVGSGKESVREAEEVDREDLKEVGRLVVSGLDNSQLLQCLGAFWKEAAPSIELPSYVKVLMGQSDPAELPP